MSDETIIRLFAESKGRYDSIGEDYGPEFFGGKIPEVGDIIASPGVIQGDDPLNPSSYTLHEVTKRYFIVRSFKPRLSLIGLVVKSRQGDESERYLMGL